MLDNQSERLLETLAELWPGGVFDGSTIAYSATFEPRLRLALLPLGLRYRKADGRLKVAHKCRIDQWIAENANRQIGALAPRRDRFGWCSVIEVRQ